MVWKTVVIVGTEYIQWLVGSSGNHISDLIANFLVGNPHLEVVLCKFRRVTSVDEKCKPSQEAIPTN